MHVMSERNGSPVVGSSPDVALKRSPQHDNTAVFLDITTQRNIAVLPSRVTLHQVILERC